MWQQHLTCSLSWCISAVATFSLPASLSSSSWFSANHLSFFFRATTSSLCLSSRTRISKVLSPDTLRMCTHFQELHIFSPYKNALMNQCLYVCLSFSPKSLHPVWPEVEMACTLAMSRSFFIICMSTSRACFSCFSLWMSSESLASSLCKKETFQWCVRQLKQNFSLSATQWYLPEKYLLELTSLWCVECDPLSTHFPQALRFYSAAPWCRWKMTEKN